MGTVVVGVDRSRFAKGVLAWAGSFAARVGAELVAVNAVVPPWSEVAPPDWEELIASRDEALARSWALPAVEAGAQVRTMARAGDPRRVIPEVAEEEGARLVVLGRSGEGGGPGWLHVGSLVEYAVHHWPDTPMAVVPGGDPGAFERIVLGVDGSGGAAAAVAWCAEVAPALGASVVAVYVKEPILEWTPASSPDNWRRQAEARVAEWTAPLSEAGVEVRTVVPSDLRPADALLGVASTVGADLLVVGLRGVGGFTGLRIGGVALKLLHRGSVPLVLVPEAG